MYLVNKQGKEENHALLIENKVYTRLHGGQLTRYKNSFEKVHEGNGFELHYVYITCHESVPESDKALCKENGFKSYAIEELQDLVLKDEKPRLTGNSIFDEFWFISW
ncbi:hypothetical protein Barb7_00659 [Bacteroidales bacterium Barb7]|nr:hypothetical protein Barb7_00659 [Bacteroidales bacterium Barb7]